MPLNDDLDKLDVAEEYLLEYAASTQEFEAALEHVRLIYRTKPEYRPRCKNLIRNVARRRRNEQHILEKLGAFA